MVRWDAQGSHWRANSGLVILVGDGHADVSHGENHEDEGLKEADEGMEAHQECGCSHGDQIHESDCDLFSGKHVREKTNRKADRTDQVRNDFDAEHEGGEPPDGAHKVLDVADDALGLDASAVVVKKGGDGNAERYRRRHGGALKSGDDAQQVGEKNKDETSSEPIGVLGTAVADNFFRLALDEGDQKFADLLQVAGLGEVEASADDPGQNQKESHNDHQHGVVVGPGPGRVVGMLSGKRNQCVGRGGKVLVQQRSEPEFMFVHSCKTR